MEAMIAKFKHRILQTACNLHCSCRYALFFLLCRCEEWWCPQIARLVEMQIGVWTTVIIRHLTQSEKPRLDQRE